MADVSEAEIERPEKGRRIKKLGMSAIMLAMLGGGGLVIGYFAANGFHVDARSNEQMSQPRLAAKEGQPIAAALAKLQGETQQKPRFKESAYNATYYAIEEPFTSNLKGSNSFAQLSVSVATYYDRQVVDNIATHETAIRSAILLTLAEQELAPLGTQQGKRALQKSLTNAINGVLKEKTGFGGVNNVYFTSFVVQ
ncbi:flagellar basal body-associated FliL family protein [Parasphingorhabdus sp.]|uniref:flagellar basal body-associated FliL family protein n=1 Tax=Parasphingorhabdus sp. TaxID=2709688 RepID=UPI002F9566C2